MHTSPSKGPNQSASETSAAPSAGHTDTDIDTGTGNTAHQGGNTAHEASLPGTHTDGKVKGLEKHELGVVMSSIG